MAVAIVDVDGRVVVDLRDGWLPGNIFGEAEYTRRVVELNRTRCYGRDSTDKAGILQYTKAYNEIMDISQVPAPKSERELAWLLSFYWNLDQAYDSLAAFGSNLDQGQRPVGGLIEKLRHKCQAAISQGIDLTPGESAILRGLGVR